MADAFVNPTLYDNFAAGFIRADETLKLTDKSPHHLLIITNERMFSYYPFKETIICKVFEIETFKVIMGAED